MPDGRNTVPVMQPEGSALSLPQRLRNCKPLIFFVMLTVLALVMTGVVRWIEGPDVGSDFTVISPKLFIPSSTRTFDKVRIRAKWAVGVPNKSTIRFAPLSHPIERSPESLLKPCAQITGKSYALHRDLPKTVELYFTNKIQNLEYVLAVQQSLEKHNVVFLRQDSSTILVVPSDLAKNYSKLERISLAQK